MQMQHYQGVQTWDGTDPISACDSVASASLDMWAYQPSLAVLLRLSLLECSFVYV